MAEERAAGLLLCASLQLLELRIFYRARGVCSSVCSSAPLYSSSICLPAPLAADLGPPEAVAVRVHGSKGVCRLGRGEREEGPGPGRSRLCWRLLLVTSRQQLLSCLVTSLVAAPTQARS